MIFYKKFYTMLILTKSWIKNIKLYLVFMIKNKTESIYNPTNPDQETSDNKKILRTFQIIVDDEFGALARIVSIFSSRGYNIEELLVKKYDSKNKTSIIIIKTICTKKMLNLMSNILDRIICVHTCQDVTPE